jgi:hypothetical protein
MFGCVGGVCVGVCVCVFSSDLLSACCVRKCGVCEKPADELPPASALTPGLERRQMCFGETTSYQIRSALLAAAHSFKKVECNWIDDDDDASDQPGAGDTLHAGQVSSYDASLRLAVAYQIPHSLPNDMAQYGPPNTTCPPQPGTSQHTIAVYLHGRTPSPAWFVSAPKMSPYRRRLWAKLSTNSDFALCRGKCSCASRQLYSCKMGAQTHTPEDTARACFEWDTTAAAAPDGIS